MKLSIGIPIALQISWLSDLRNGKSCTDKTSLYWTRIFILNKDIDDLVQDCSNSTGITAVLRWAIDVTNIDIYIFCKGVKNEWSWGNAYEWATTTAPYPVWISLTTLRPERENLGQTWRSTLKVQM